LSEDNRTEELDKETIKEVKVNAKIASLILKYKRSKSNQFNLLKTTISYIEGLTGVTTDKFNDYKKVEV